LFICSKLLSIASAHFATNEYETMRKTSWPTLRHSNMIDNVQRSKFKVTARFSSRETPIDLRPSVCCPSGGGIRFDGVASPLTYFLLQPSLVIKQENEIVREIKTQQQVTDDPSGWLRSTVGRTPVFGRRTDPVLRSTCS